MDEQSRRGKVDDLIEANLKSVYDSILQEEVPSRFTELLAELEAREKGMNGEEAAAGGGIGGMGEPGDAGGAADR
jgi:hypothetical protein